MKIRLMLVTLIATGKVAVASNAPPASHGSTGAVVASNPTPHPAFNLLSAGGMRRDSLTATNTLGPVILYVNAVRGPDTSSVSYQGWATAVASNLYSTRSNLYAAVGDVGFRFQVPYVCQTTDLSGSVVWFTVHAVARDPSYMFLPGQLSFSEWSTDQANSLAKMDAFTNSYYVYTPVGFGVIWGQGGRGFADKIVNSGYCDQTPVNEYVFIGSMSTYYIYGTNGWTLGQISNYVNSVSKFNVTGRWQFTDANGSWYAQKTLYRDDAPVLLPPKAQVLTNGMVIGFGNSVATGDTWVLMHSLTMLNPSWSDIASVNGNDVMVVSIVPPAPPQGYWKLRLE